MKKDIFDQWTEHKNREALDYKGKILTYQKLNCLVEGMVEYLKGSNIHNHDHVALKIKNPILYVEFFLALWKLGVTIVPIDTQESSGFLMELLFEAEVQHYITDKIDFDIESLKEKNSQRGCLQQIIHYTDVKKNSYKMDYYHSQSLWKKNNNLDSKFDFIILFTSGTSGDKKGVLIKKESFLNNVLKVIEYTELRKEDSILLTLPLSYCFALSQLLAHIVAGAKCVLYGNVKINEGILSEIEEKKVTNFAATPYFFETLVKEKSQGSLEVGNHRLRFIMSAGGYLSASTIASILKLFPDVVFYNNYGQTEAAPRLCYNKITSNNDNLGSIGKPLKGIEIEIFGDAGEKLFQNKIGEIGYRSEDAMEAYYGRDKIDKNQYIMSGDLGCKDSNGNITIMGRKDSMIKINGRKVYKNTIEDRLNELDCVRMIKLKKEVHDRFGEYFVAYVILNKGHEEEDSIQLIREYCKKKFDKNSIPRKLILCKSFTLTSNQKIKFSEDGK